MAFLPSLFLTLLTLAAAIYFFPSALRTGGQVLGSYLRRSSLTRRELLLARVAKEQRDHDAKHGSEKNREDDEWEEVETSMVGSAVNGGKADKDWSGIVGFFHPFW
jgi:alpha-1,2-mannosyltransferase